MTADDKDVQSYTANGTHPVGLQYTPEERLAKQELFCSVYAKSLCNISRACRKAGISRSTYTYWINNDRLFISMLDDAALEARDRLRDVVKERGVDGVEEPLVVNGRVIRDADGNPVMIYKPDNRVLLALARAYLPEFRSDVAHDTSGDINMETLLQDYLMIEKKWLTDGDASWLRDLGLRIEERKRAAIVDAVQ